MNRDSPHRQLWTGVAENTGLECSHRDGVRGVRGRRLLVLNVQDEAGPWSSNVSPELQLMPSETLPLPAGSATGRD